MVVDNFFELWIIMKNIVEKYPFITKILQKILKILSFIQYFFSKINTKNKKQKKLKKY